jgi:hypothetical protein
MRTAIIALAATTNLALGSVGALAGPQRPVQVSPLPMSEHEAIIENANWYCGPHCHYWRQRHWEERHWRYGYRPYHHYYRYGYRY